MMFVFTASRAEARTHYKCTIENPVMRASLAKHLGKERTRAISAKCHGSIYAWGATPGPRNIPLWNKIAPGDCAVAYQHRHFTCLLNVVDKVHHKELAVEFWGYGSNADNKGKTWEYVYFLEKVKKLSIGTHLRFPGHTGPLDRTASNQIASTIQNHTGFKVHY